ncbi:oxygen-dependent tRNA uridine(34) hydroxylase TrhO [Flectobacillus roseus]|uniref:tRNA uridine(34) hydroxylase n=1 Tax=Flectobacillus roseus TaxID=502259 RepID=A0ABT6Y4B6_9BACT|nr:rhodanese-related sulfurtransferase [Flectobacillus roseus]MDI9858409.1 rhodanese-related sulfurtransferase [Flectobacillus roseus]
MKPYRVLLYYNYTPIPNPEEYREIHHLYCIENNLLGRIIVAAEGLNGTVSGLAEDCEKYMQWLQNDPIFAGSDFDFKVEEHDTHAFAKLHVRVKEEIVNSDLPVNPRVRTGKHLEPADFKELLKNDPDVVLVDMRSNYEHSVGKFKGAITFDMETLRELPDHVHEIEHLKDKKIITYCTGGIKCEKASAYLIEKGFENVYQLHGGIIKYGLEEGGEDFEGKCYVFDNRVTTSVNTVNPEVISKCHICETISDHMVNCANPECNEHVPICPSCLEKMEGACSDECKNHPRKRPYNPSGYYSKQSDNYSPEFGFKSRQKTNVDYSSFQLSAE